MIVNSREHAEAKAEQKRLQKLREDQQNLQTAITLAQMGGGVGDAPQITRTAEIPAPRVAAPPMTMQAPRLDGTSSSVQVPRAAPKVSPTGDSAPETMTVTGTDPNYMNLPGGYHIKRPEVQAAEQQQQRLRDAEQEARTRGNVALDLEQQQRRQRLSSIAAVVRQQNPTLTQQQAEAKALEKIEGLEPQQFGTGTSDWNEHVRRTGQLTTATTRATTRGAGDVTPTTRYSQAARLAHGFLAEMAALDEGLREKTLKPDAHAIARDHAKKRWGFQDEAAARAAIVGGGGGVAPAGGGGTGTTAQKQTITQDQYDFLREVRGMSDAEIRAMYDVGR